MGMECRGGWDERYARGDTPWNLAGPPPCLVDLLASLSGDPLRVLVPGAGHGHDAFAWAAAGYDVTAVDIAPRAVALARREARTRGLRLAIEEEDLFSLPARFEGRFDVVWEQTCFCAIAPERRPDYVQAVARALAPQGLLHGLFWNHGHAGGPPYDVTREQVRTAFDAAFALLECSDIGISAGGRQNEFLVRMQRRVLPTG